MNGEIEAIEPAGTIEQAMCERILSRTRKQIDENRPLFSSAYVIGLIIYDLDEAEYLEVSISLNNDSDWTQKQIDGSVEPYRKWDWHYWSSSFDRRQVFGDPAFPEDQLLLTNWVKHCNSNALENYRDQLIRFWGLITQCGLLLRADLPNPNTPLLIDNGVLDDWPVEATSIANPDDQADQLLRERF